MTASIHLGFEIGTGRAVEIPLRHMAVTGQTQESGKTTTLEGLIARSELRAVAYVTKRGESSFRVAHPIAPYFQERADWQFVLSLLEASTQTKLKFEQSWIMRASEGAKTLQDVRANIHRFLSGVRDTTPVRRKKSSRAADRERKERWIQKPARGLSGDIYYVLSKYLDALMPQLEELPYSSTLDLGEGLNVMDLRDYEFPLQALVVRSVIDWTRDHGENTINVIPEAWKFAPKQKGSPVRQSAEELIREGGALKNFLWIDSQDLAGVADVLMRQVGVWIFGVQRAKHEIERALDHMPEGLPVRRPRSQDIATLNKGQFYVCYGREMYKVYVQPAWMKAAHAEAIARGEEDVDSAREILSNFDQEAKRHGDRDGISAAGSRKNRSAVVATDAESKDISLPHLRQHSGAERDCAASDRGAFNTDHHAAESAEGKETPEEGEDEMNHEGFRQAVAEALCLKGPADDNGVVQAVRNLVQSHDALADRVSALEGHAGKKSAAVESARPSSSQRAPGAATAAGPQGAPSLNDMYQYVVARLRKEGPQLLRLIAQEPELRVAIERPVLDVDGSTFYGRMVQLVKEGFFKSPRSYADATDEGIRRGWCSAKTPKMRSQEYLDKLAGMGFLTREIDGYQAVPGMKITIVEEKASRASA